MQSYSNKSKTCSSPLSGGDPASKLASELRDVISSVIRHKMITHKPAPFECIEAIWMQDTEFNREKFLDTARSLSYTLSQFSNISKLMGKTLRDLNYDLARLGEGVKSFNKHRANHRDDMIDTPDNELQKFSELCNLNDILDIERAVPIYQSFYASLAEDLEQRSLILKDALEHYGSEIAIMRERAQNKDVFTRSSVKHENIDFSASRIKQESTHRSSDFHFSHKNTPANHFHYQEKPTREPIVAEDDDDDDESPFTMLEEIKDPAENSNTKPFSSQRRAMEMQEEEEDDDESSSNSSGERKINNNRLNARSKKISRTGNQSRSYFVKLASFQQEFARQWEIAKRKRGSSRIYGKMLGWNVRFDETDGNLYLESDKKKKPTYRWQLALSQQSIFEAGQTREWGSIIEKVLDYVNQMYPK